MADQVDQLVGCVGFAVGVEDEDGAADFGGRVEGAGVEGHEDAGLGVELDVEGEEAVGVVAGFGDDAVGDFLLQHEDGALAVRVGDDAAQDGGADVVGEVADGAVGAGGEGGLEVAGFTTQERFLMALGEGNELADLYVGGESEEEKLQARLKLKRLIFPGDAEGPGGMGTVFKVLIQHRGMRAPKLTGLKHSDR